LLQP
jgi:hypothetical protein